MNVKNRIEQKLNEHEQTKSWLAGELAVEKQNLNNWMARDKIPERYLFKTARLLECDPEWLASGQQSSSNGQVQETRADYKIESDIEKEIRKLSPADTEKVASFIQGLKAGRSN